jgi:pimeloyl-ACP methyl ester carboxylesterase
VLTPDTPGLGESDRPVEPATPRSIAADIAAGIDMLIGDDAEYDICGFSYGAMLASVTAALHGKRVRSLTVVGPGALGLPRANVVLEKVRSRQGQDRIDAHRTNLGIFMLDRAHRIDDIALAIQDYNTTHARFKSKDFAHTTALSEAIAATPAPVHAIWGDHDASAAPDIPTRIAALRAARPDARVTVIPNAGHWAAWDAPEEFEAALRTSFRD